MLHLREVAETQCGDSFEIDLQVITPQVAAGVFRASVAGPSVVTLPAKGLGRESRLATASGATPRTCRC